MKMIKTLLLTLFSLIIFGCTANQINAIDQIAQQGSIASFGSLSNKNNKLEQLASVAYTDLARYRYNAASLLRQKRITKQQAIIYLKISDSIRSDLDKAVINKNIKGIRNEAYRIKFEIKKQETRQ